MAGAVSGPDGCLGPADVTNSHDSPRDNSISFIFGSGRKSGSSLDLRGGENENSWGEPIALPLPQVPGKPEESGNLRSLSPSCVWGADGPNESNESSEKYCGREELIGHTWEGDLGACPSPPPRYHHMGGQVCPSSRTQESKVA